jgi:excisionase family DNA binding protein
MNLGVIENNQVIQESITLDKIGYAIEEISAQTSLSKAYLRQKIREGNLKATHFGRRVVVLRSDLEAFLKNGSK